MHMYLLTLLFEHSSYMFAYLSSVFFLKVCPCVFTCQISCMLEPTWAIKLILIQPLYAKLTASFIVYLLYRCGTGTV